MLTSDQEAIITATAPVVAEHLNDITARFYPLMFERYPDVRFMFNEAHQREGTQPRALAGSVLSYVQLRQDPEAVKAALSTAIHKHVSLGVEPGQYAVVGECLMAAIGEVLGDAVTPEIADAWGALYWEFADLLIEVEGETLDEFASRPGGWRGAREFRVAAIEPESSVITSFLLEPTDGGPVAEHAPGQFIGVRLKIDGQPVYRHYSLSDVPRENYYRLSIKREADGTASKHFHDELRVGDTLELLPPAGDLTLVDGDEPLLLVSGGVGQTPLIAMARQALAAGREVVYIHSAPTPDEHAFADEVEELASTYPELLTSVTVYTQHDDPDLAGRVNHALLEQHLPEGARCYYVGPQSFMTAVDAALVELGIPADRRHFEQFGPSRPLATA